MKILAMPAKSGVEEFVLGRELSGICDDSLSCFLVHMSVPSSLGTQVKPKRKIGWS